MSDYQQIILNDGYVLTPCRNAFNNKISFWLSRQNYMYAMYCFSIRPEDQAEYAYQTHHMRGYIKMFEERFILTQKK